MTPDDISSINNFSDEEILNLYAKFRSIDKARHDGCIDVSELLNRNPELAENPLTRRVISVFDKNKDGKVSFVEFVTGLARATTDDHSKRRFLFDVYDVDGDGLISNADLFNAVKMMSGDNLTQMQLQQLVDRTMRDADIDCDGKLSFDEFNLAIRSVAIDDQLGLDDT
jgi:serine/threonine-protein phosphatase 2B regulatory subunit